MSAATFEFDFSKAKVLVIGDVMLDRYWYGSTNRISPEAPVPVVKVTQQEERPGGAGNVALNIAAYGAKVTLLGVLGDDEPGDKLLSQLEAAGVDVHFQRLSGVPTITKLRIISRHQQLMRLDAEENIQDHIDQHALMANFQHYLNDVDLVVLSDYAKGTLHESRALIDAAKQAGIPVIVDPKHTDYHVYRGASLITPNIHEFETVAGDCDDEAAILKRATTLCEKFDLESILITRGERGMTLVRSTGEESYLPTQAKEVFDVTGAGDTVVATLAVAIASGATYEEAMVYANMAAGIVVGKMGAATVSMPELKGALWSDKAKKRGVMNQDQLLMSVLAARASGQTIAMTNGCFDILHAGHVHYLNLAKEQADRLVVAVNDDASVSRLKGPSRPINSVERRMAVLAGLSCVDWVVSFSQDTPEQLLEFIRPDVLIKGGDYDPEEVVGAEIVKDYGGEVKVLGYVEGLSTTSTIEKISIDIKTADK